jgi:hypothetical protein
MILQAYLARLGPEAYSGAGQGAYVVTVKVFVRAWLGQKSKIKILSPETFCYEDV